MALILATIALTVSIIDTLLVWTILRAVIVPMAPTLRSLYRRALDNPAPIVINHQTNGKPNTSERP